MSDNKPDLSTIDNGASATNGEEPEAKLPRLRKELIIREAGSYKNGAPSWLIYDGLRNRYFRIGEDYHKLLSIWEPLTVDEMADKAMRVLRKPVFASQIDELTKFLFVNNLTVESPDGTHDSFMRQNQAGKHGVFWTIVHNYIFFKIPLFRPQKFLDATWPIASMFFSKGFGIFVIMMALVAFYLLSRQWETFLATFFAYLSFEGAALYIVSLIILKIFHELGHAYFARKFKVAVPTIGIAFILLFPILYTDTSGAARIRSRRDRLLINFGGILVELSIAVFAIWFWVFLPDGPLRGIAFTTATLSLVLSLIVNLNPFMRFDGYYILSDLMDIENLQKRGFDMAKWKMRELLFRPGKLPPEAVSHSTRRFLILYSWGVWIYRFFLFLGIAFIVYHFFIKIVGIFLFIVEIVWFILMPIYKEMKIWWEEKGSFSSKRVVLVSLILIVGLSVGLTPLSTQVKVAAVRKAPQQVRIFANSPGVLEDIKLQEGKLYKKSEILAVLDAPELNTEINISKLRVNLLSTRISRSHSDDASVSHLNVLRQEHEAEKEKLESLVRSKDQLIIRAPFEGYVVNLDPDLHLGQWIGQERPLSMFISKLGVQISGLVSGEDVGRLVDGASGVFFEDGRIVSNGVVELTGISEIAERKLEYEILADQQGGILPTKSQGRGQYDLVGDYFRLEMKLDAEDPAISSMSRGVVFLEGQSQSYLGAIARRVASVLIREASF